MRCGWVCCDGEWKKGYGRKEGRVVWLVEGGDAGMMYKDTVTGCGGGTAEFGMMVVELVGGLPM